MSSRATDPVGKLGRGTTEVSSHWRQPGDGARRRAYGAYVWLVVVVIGLAVWPAVALVLDERHSWALTRWSGRLILRLTGISLCVAGDLPSGDEPYVAVANHSSFVDGMVVVLTFPRPVVIVAGGELASQKVAGPFLRGLGCVFTRQEDARRRDAVDRFVHLLAAGQSLAVFPEASLSSEAGIRRFNLGAFLIAAKARACVLPIGIRNSGDIVGPGSRLPARAKVQVTIGEPIAASGSGVADAIALRDAARAAVIELSGEPDLIEHHARSGKWSGATS